MIYTKYEMIEIFRPIVELNDALQHYVETGTLDLDRNGFLEIVRRLDDAIKNTGEKAT